MTKKELFGRIASHFVTKNLKTVYNLDILFLSEKQQLLVDLIVEDLYDHIGKELSLKELQEKYDRLFYPSKTIQKD